MVLAASRVEGNRLVGQPRPDRGRVGCAYPNLLKMTALVASLGVSAFSMAVALGSSDHWWVGWVALLPLFVSIRVLAPVKAMLAGAFWGLCLFVSLVTTADGALSPSLAALALLTAVPAIYTWLGARLTRRVGFSPYLLALGWMGVELALSLLGLRNGLLAATQGDGLIIHLVGNFTGCVLVAFLVAYISASVLEAISRVRVPADGLRFAAGAPDSLQRLFPQESFSVLFHLIRPLQPRAPPMSLR